MKYQELKNQRGATMIEYALLIALMSIIAIVAVRYFGTSNEKVIGTVATTLDNGCYGGIGQCGGNPHTGNGRGG